MSTISQIIEYEYDFSDQFSNSGIDRNSISLFFFDKKMKKYRYGVSGVAGFRGSPHLTENEKQDEPD